MTVLFSQPARGWAGAALVLALGTGALACGADSEAAQDTSGTTRGLLDSRQGQADVSAPGSVGPGQERPIDVAVLGVDHGSEDALVRVVEFSDYGCGYCRRFQDETWPMIRDEFIAEGKVQWKFLPFVTGMFQNSPVATEASECALEQSPDVFAAMNDRLWQDQQEWKNASDAHTVVRGYAAAAGADQSEWDACMASDRRAERVMAATALARQLGVRGTPTFFVIGYAPLQGAPPTETFRQVLNSAYAEAQTRAGG